MEKVTLDAIPSLSVIDAVYEALRKHVIAGALAPGERLHVAELAQQLGVSRTPVDGALKRLVAEGLVQIVPRHGTYVSMLTVEDIIETYDVRRALELAAAERLVQQITSEDLLALEKAVEAIRADLTKDDDIEQHVRSNFVFHELFVQLSGNRKLLVVFQGLNSPIQTARIHYRSPNWRQRLVYEEQEHKAILVALRERDAKALADAIAAHLNRAKMSLVADMMEQSAPNTVRASAGQGKTGPFLG